ncbi:MAG: hypothetical protein GW867_07380 [Armatimonadetes bacterium]|nr:hypothetical protein [Armatimonadota bacterium]
MNSDQLVVGIIVGAAALSLVWRLVRTAKRGAACCDDPACTPADCEACRATGSTPPSSPARRGCDRPR